MVPLEKKGLKTESGYVLNGGSRTMVFLREESRDPTFYLARQKQNIVDRYGVELSGSAKLSGYGGVYKPSDKSIFHTATRELFITSGVQANEEDLTCVAHIRFFFPDNKTKDCNIDIFFFVVERFSGDPIETEFMEPPNLYTVRGEFHVDALLFNEELLRRILRDNVAEGEIYFERKKSTGELSISSHSLMFRPLYT